MTKLNKYAALAIIGGVIYGLIEFVGRGWTHWSMVLLGGICFVVIGLINEIIPWEMPFPLQMLIGGAVITILEFISGCIVNLWFGWHIWDYSGEWANIFGQICPKYSCLWVALSAVAIILDDYLRYWFFGKEKPHYKFI